MKASHYKSPPMICVEESKNEIEVLTGLSGGAIPLNPEPDGSCRTIKAQYAKTSFANFLRTGTWGATGVIEIVKKEDSNE